MDDQFSINTEMGIHIINFNDLHAKDLSSLWD